MKPPLTIFFTLCSVLAFGSERDVSIPDTIREMCKDIPEGVYTLSITRQEFAAPDNGGREMRNKLTFSPETAIFLRAQKGDNDEQLLDYYCLSDSTPTTATQELLPFETGQTISGRIEGGSKKLDNFNLKIMIPSVGRILGTHTEGRRFNLTGLDFVDGTTFSIQALKENGKEGSLRLIVDEPCFPDISVKGYHYARERVKTTDSASDYIKNKSRLADIINTIDLPDVVVRERRLKPMNRFGQQPDRAIEDDDPILEMANSIDLVLSRFGLRRGFGFVPFETITTELIYIEGFGHFRDGAFRLCEVMIDDHMLRDYELTEVANLNPKDIKRVEYFLPSNYTLYGNLNNYKGLYGDVKTRGLLMIWIKTPGDFSYFKHRRPSSLTNIHPLGYKPPMTFAPRTADNFNTTIYWNPAFSPKDATKTLPAEIPLPSSSNITIKLEGLSDTGEQVYRRKIVRL